MKLAIVAVLAVVLTGASANPFVPQKDWSACGACEEVVHLAEKYAGSELGKYIDGVIDDVVCAAVADEFVFVCKVALHKVVGELVKIIEKHEGKTPHAICHEVHLC